MSSFPVPLSGWRGCPDGGRDQISDIRPPKKSNIRYHAFAKMRYLALKIRYLISDPPKKINYQISRYPRSTPPPMKMFQVASLSGSTTGLTRMSRWRCSRWCLDPMFQVVPESHVPGGARIPCSRWCQNPMFQVVPESHVPGGARIPCSRWCLDPMFSQVLSISMVSFEKKLCHSRKQC